jgi:hypothetical protein
MINFPNYPAVLPVFAPLESSFHFESNGQVEMKSLARNDGSGGWFGWHSTFL